jgi:hypothetical protein
VDIEERGAGLGRPRRCSPLESRPWALEHASPLGAILDREQPEEAQRLLKREFGSGERQGHLCLLGPGEPGDLSGQTHPEEALGEEIGDLAGEAF